jgi:hypothetical protein
MSDRAGDVAPIYVAARRVLLDALAALAPQTDAVIVVGAQAVYMRTGRADIAIAPYTTDADLALDPSKLGTEPRLDQLMRDAGFSLQGDQPGAWVVSVMVDGRPAMIPVDLMVPDALSPGGGRRSAGIPPHHKMTARKAIGLEAAVLDNDVMDVGSLDASDERRFPVRVAGSTALLVAKLHKLGERIAAGREDRVADKDAGDVYRLMQATPTGTVVERVRSLLADGMAGPATGRAMELLGDLFGARARPGVRMAVEALRAAVPSERVEGVCDVFVREVLGAFSSGWS